MAPILEYAATPEADPNLLYVFISTDSVYEVCELKAGTPAKECHDRRRFGVPQLLALQSNLCTGSWGRQSSWTSMAPESGRWSKRCGPPHCAACHCGSPTCVGPCSCASLCLADAVGPGWGRMRIRAASGRTCCGLASALRSPSTSRRTQTPSCCPLCVQRTWRASSRSCCSLQLPRGVPATTSHLLRLFRCGRCST